MKIIKLEAENVKRLKAVSIEPDGTLQVIGGRNSQGKTSVMDAIWLALGGATAARATARPVRDGEYSASVKLDLGDIVVTRTWDGDKTSVKVEAADGAKYASPQGLLDNLLGKFAFDPLAFTLLKPKEQVTALLDLVKLDVDLDALAKERQDKYDERTDLGRQIKTLEGQLAGLPPIAKGTPFQEVSVGELIAQYQAALETEQRITKSIERRAKINELIYEYEQELAEITAWEASTPSVTGSLMIQREIDSLETTNAAVRAALARSSTEGNLEELRAAHTATADRIDAIDGEKAGALARATLPVQGLGFDDEGVTFNGIPFSQVSSSEQIRVSLAMAMAGNPKLRVMQIRDGSLLDPDGMALVAKMAAEADYQVWIERVGNADEAAVIIEDGEVQE